MKCAVLLASLFGGVAYGVDKIATATFGTGTKITGVVEVELGSISVNIDLSALNTSDLPGNCTAGGLRYHVHTMWNYNDTNDRIGETACGASYTGNHYDPWLACSSSSSESYCSSQGGCVDGSSALGGVNTTYSCNSTNFEDNAYVCEVGDWSGKYGYLNIDSTKLSGKASGESAFELDASDLDSMSIVFHCNDNTRAFCAPFVIKNSTENEERVEQSSATSQQAKFSDINNSTITLYKTGEVEVNFNLTGVIETLPDGCNELLYRVYNAWDLGNTTTVSSNNNINNNINRRLLANSTVNTTMAFDMNTTTINSENTTVVSEPTTSPTMMPTSAPTIDCSAVSGAFYDPSVTCAHGSEHSGTYCTGLESSKLCGEETYSYSCSDKYSCAPGDLSGKYGTLDLTKNETSFNITTTDEVMIDLTLLSGKSVVLQCSNDDYYIVACSEWNDYTPSPHGGSSSSSDNSTPAWVWVIVAIGAILLIAGAIFLCRRCKTDDSYTRIQK